MRRSEFSIEDREEIRRFLQECTHGVLGTVNAQGEACLTPLNYLYQEGTLYFHGSPAGEKMTNIRENPSVTFSVVRELSFLPSHFSGTEIPCNASTYFQSVVIRGKARVMDDPESKAEILEGFMKRFQPEGKHIPMDALLRHSPDAIRKTALISLVPASTTAKYKLGQNLPREKFDELREALLRREAPSDRTTERLMRLFHPEQESPRG